MLPLPTVLAVLLAGLSQVLAAPPANLYWLQLVVYAPALLALSRLDGRRAVLAGWLFGLSANAAIFSWLFRTVERFTTLGAAGGAGVLLLFAAAFGFYGAVFGWGAAAVRRASGALWPLGLAAWFVACEFLNPQLFPYLQGVAWYQVPSVFLVTALTGVSGVSFLLFAWNGLLAAGLERWLAARGRLEPMREDATLRRSGAVFAVLLVGSLAYAGLRGAALERVLADSPTVRFALVQPNRDVAALNALNKETRGGARADLLALTRDTLEADPDIDVVMWAEGALRGNPLHRKRREVLDLLAEHDVALWTGVVEGRGPRRQRTRHNGAYRVQPDGTLSPPYDKNILVPFGEFMPLAGLIPALGRIRDFPSLTPGAEPAILSGPEAPPVGFLVCYEATRTRYVRHVATAGAEVLGTVTYDGWFGDTAALDQHMMLAASMSALFGRPQVRAAATGISMATGPDGVLLGRTERNQRTALVVDVPMATLDTPYRRWGDWLPWLCIVLGFGLAARGVPRAGPLAPGLFLLAAPLTWAINPHVPWPDKAVWTAAVLLAAVACWRRRAVAAALLRA